ncbi:hypothetical protein [Phormidium sp. FACHB-1136]|uniref:hypothetical protein n=1 Tax=Phormidium sp. FACHB-1136 TaxID=2692848 RepID=UPI001682AC9B|nr:hypothetical protein [Phormidium sp. FACHB-1136]MBD2429437.1 hypothetical protein [Phormidium sp. FACHB-1136]
MAETALGINFYRIGTKGTRQSSPGTTLALEHRSSSRTTLENARLIHALLSTMTDPDRQAMSIVARSTGRPGVEHPFLSLVMIAILAVIGEAMGWVVIGVHQGFLGLNMFEGRVEQII